MLYNQLELLSDSRPLLQHWMKTRWSNCTSLEVVKQAKKETRATLILLTEESHFNHRLYMNSKKSHHDVTYWFGSTCLESYHEAPLRRFGMVVTIYVRMTRRLRQPNLQQSQFRAHCRKDGRKNLSSLCKKKQKTQVTITAL